MKIKLTAILLAVIFLLTCGCSANKDSGETGELMDSDEKNKLLFTANGSEITEEYFKYFVNYYKTEMESTNGEIEDWDALLQDGMTYWEYIKEMSLDWFKYAGAVRAQAIRLGIEMAEEDYSILQNSWDSMCESSGGEEAAIAQLAETYCTKSMYNYIMETNLLTAKCFDAMYGLYGADFSDEDCAEKVAEDGYMMAKHILITTSIIDENGNTVELTEDEKAEAYKKAESILVQLDQCEPDVIEERFDELMFSFTDDAGISGFPEGYLFQEGDMLEEFSNATKELEIGEYSGIVETSAGYHIILRIPVNYDVTPVAYSSYLNYGYDYYTLRYIIAQEVFQANMASWTERAEVVFEEAYETVTMDSLLAVG